MPVSDLAAPGTDSKHHIMQHTFLMTFPVRLDVCIFQVTITDQSVVFQRVGEDVFSKSPINFQPYLRFLNLFCQAHEWYADVESF